MISNEIINKIEQIIDGFFNDESNNIESALKLSFYLLWNFCDEEITIFDCTDEENKEDIYNNLLFEFSFEKIQEIKEMFLGLDEGSLDTFDEDNELLLNLLSYISESDEVSEETKNKIIKFYDKYETEISGLLSGYDDEDMYEEIMLFYDQFMKKQELFKFKVHALIKEMVLTGAVNFTAMMVKLQHILLLYVLFRQAVFLEWNEGVASFISDEIIEGNYEIIFTSETLDYSFLLKYFEMSFTDVVWDMEDLLTVLG